MARPHKYEKTQWCETCGHRHLSTHEHFKSGAPAPSQTVVGAQTAAQLKDQAVEKVPAATQPVAPKLKRGEVPPLLPDQRQALERKWGRRLRIPYAVLARVLQDPEIRLSDEEAHDGAVIHADMAEAFGWVKATKIEAVADCIVWHGATIAMRSKWARELFEEEEEAKKKEGEAADDGRPRNWAGEQGAG